MIKELIRPLFSCLLLAFIVSIGGPIEIILANIDELAYGLSSHIESAFIFFVAFASAFLLLFILAFLINKRLFQFLEVFFTAAIIVTLLNKTLLYGDYGAFDGRGLDIDSLSILSALQLLIAAAVWILFWRKRNLLSIALTMGAIYTTTTLVISFYTLGGEGKVLTRHPFPVAQEYFKFSKSTPNYLYIMLDEVYGGSAREIFESGAIPVDSFTGFTFYTDVAGVYPTTIVSVPAILNGSLYQNKQPVSDYIADSFGTSQLFQLLMRQNYPAYVHTSGMYCHHIDLESCSNMGDMLPSQKAANQEYGKALELTVFKMAPEFLKPFIYNNGNWLFENILVRSGGTRRGSFQVNEFRYFIDEINANASGSSFKFYHNTVTHSPVRHDSGCDLLIRNRPPTYENYLEQDKCGFSLVGKLLDRLRELEVYDNTYIVISSDHGRPFVPLYYQNLFADSPSGASYKQYGYAHAMLMVKPLATGGNLAFSKHPMSLLDIGRLFIAAIEDWSPLEYPLDEKEDRPFHYYYWSKKYFDWRQNFLPPFESVYLIDADVSNPLSWRENTGEVKLAMQRQLHHPLQCDHPILFSEDSQRKRYASFGLSFIEPWGRWSEGSKVRLYFMGDALVCPLRRIRLDIKAYLRKEKPTQHANIFFNDERIGEVTFRYGEEKHKEVILDFSEDSYLAGSINTIELRITDPVSPQSLGYGNDTRKLALGFKGLVLQ